MGKLKIEEARNLALQWHENTYGNQPYIYHLSCVRETWELLFAENTTREEQPEFIIVCYLHDILEDTDIDPHVIKDMFSEAVYETVMRLTKKEGVSYKNYLKAMVEDTTAFQVKVADTYSNLQHSMMDQNNRRIKRYGKQLELLYKFREEYIDNTTKKFKPLKTISTKLDSNQ